MNANIEPLTAIPISNSKGPSPEESRSQAVDRATITEAPLPKAVIHRILPDKRPLQLWIESCIYSVTSLCLGPSLWSKSFSISSVNVKGSSFL